MRGTTLTARRLEAAQILERHEDHVRKHIEPKLLDELAFALHQENLRYKPVAESPLPTTAAHEDTPVLTENSYTEQEELLCRVWSAVYGYRAELIATGVASERPGTRSASLMSTSRSTSIPVPGS